MSGRNMLFPDCRRGPNNLKGLAKAASTPPHSQMISFAS
jgi:hypothetical protein